MKKLNSFTVSISNPHHYINRVSNRINSEASEAISDWLKKNKYVDIVGMDRVFSDAYPAVPDSIRVWYVENLSVKDGEVVVADVASTYEVGNIQFSVDKYQHEKLCIEAFNNWLAENDNTELIKVERLTDPAPDSQHVNEIDSFDLLNVWYKYNITPTPTLSADSPLTQVKSRLLRLGVVLPIIAALVWVALVMVYFVPWVMTL